MDGSSNEQVHIMQELSVIAMGKHVAELTEKAALRMCGVLLRVAHGQHRTMILFGMAYPREPRMLSAWHFLGLLVATWSFLTGCSCSEENAHDDADGGGVPSGSGNSSSGAGSSNGGAGSSSGGTGSGDGTGGISRTFTHPGLLHTEADFERMRAKVDEGAEPWASTWNTLVNYEDTSLDQVPAPLDVLVRGGDGENYLVLIDDLRAMYGLSLAWNITKDDRYGDLAVRFVNAWSSTLTEISGTTDRYLAAGLYGYQLANVGEILRNFSGWKTSDQERFRTMLLELFYPLNSEWLKNHDGSCETHFWANWDMSNLAGMMAIGIYADRADIYAEALDYLHSGKGNGALESMIYYVHPGNLGQFQESGRDQGHSNLGVTLMGVIGKQAWNQGDDLFAWKGHRLLSALEYIARYNVGEDVPYVPYGPNCVGVRQDVVSDIGRGHKRRSWLLPLNHYRNRLGIATPWMEAKHTDVGDEVWRWSNDELGWGSLTESLDPLDRGGAPQDLSGHLQGSSIVLSWWGSVGASEYVLERASESGAFSQIATVAAEDDLTFTDADLLPTETYRYRVRAVFADSTASEWSNTETVDAGPKLKLHLTFEELGDGDAVENEVDGKEGATLHDGATLGAGKSGRALELNGIDAYAALAPDYFVDLSDFTIAAWLQVNEDRDFARLFDLGANDQRYVALAPRVGESARFMMTKVSYFAEEAVTGEPISAGAWTHVALTLSGTTAILYVNGVEAGRTEGLHFAPHRIGLEQAWLGRSHYDADPPLSGSIDDFRLYSGALGPSEVLVLATP